MAQGPKLAIVGQGNVGSAIEKGAQDADYEVRTTGNDAAQVRKLGAWADVILLAVPYGERFNALSELGDIKGKTLVDATNALGPDGFAGSLEKSGAEELQERAAGAHVVKAFNAVFAQNMATGTIDGEPITLLVAGDDAAAKRQVLDLGAAIGFHAVDAGSLENARWLETMGYFLIQLGYGLEMGSGIGFRLAGAPAAPSREEPQTAS